MVCPSLHANVLTKAKSGQNLAASVNVGAFNLANGIGAMVGGHTIKIGFALNIIPIVAIIGTSIGLCLATYNTIQNKI